MITMIERMMGYLRWLWLRVQFAFQLSCNDAWSRWLTSASFSLLLITHLVVLPAHILGPDIGLRSFQHLTLKITVFAFLFAALESVLINLWVYMIRHKTHCRTAPAAGGIVIGIVSPLLCCTPLLPTILSFLAILFPKAVSGWGITIQYGVNVYQTELLILALGLLLLAIVQNARCLKSEQTMKKCTEE